MSKAIGVGAGAGVLVLCALGVWQQGQPGLRGVSVPAHRVEGMAVVPTPMADTTYTAPDKTTTNPTTTTGQETISGAPSAVAYTAAQASAGTAVPNQTNDTVLKAQLDGLSAPGRHPSPLEMDQWLAKLQQSQGKEALGAVDVNTLRHNLQATARLHALTQQLLPLAQNPTVENNQKLQLLVAEIQQVQGALRTDVLAPK
ncbi:MULTISPECIES: hypothetical protein [Giesbergeria]|uniref:Uncharacterized protein n=1 Tax=Giesbergeria sinuosa TaxID=80883 RepID=A0ABV9QEL6_9BURK